VQNQHAALMQQRAESGPKKKKSQNPLFRAFAGVEL
jgi:hypothetical protein